MKEKVKKENFGGIDHQNINTCTHVQSKKNVQVEESGDSVKEEFCRHCIDHQHISRMHMNLKLGKKKVTA